MVHIKSWFLFRLPTAAPANDLNLLKRLVQVESPSAKDALKKLCGQLWYLSEDLAALAFFDRDIDASEKRAMVEGLRTERKILRSKYHWIDQSTIPDLFVRYK